MPLDRLKKAGIGDGAPPALLRVYEAVDEHNDVTCCRRVGRCQSRADVDREAQLIPDTHRDPQPLAMATQPVAPEPVGIGMDALGQRWFRGNRGIE